jgi:MFS transporter, PAT family, beta-lactamase induction signal transducer AmpG
VSTYDQRECARRSLGEGGTTDNSFLKAAKDWFGIYLHPRILVVLLLGFSSGLPLLLVGGTLSARLTDAGIQMAQIGLFAYVMLPYTFKFLWAPLVDQIPVPVMTKVLGRRRGWMVTAQILMALSLVALAFTDPVQAPGQTALLALLVAVCSATQDITIDAYRTEYLDPKQYGEGSVTAVFGYRLGMLAAGAGALYLADGLNWQVSYLVMAALLGVGLVTALVAGEPKTSVECDVLSVEKENTEHSAPNTQHLFKDLILSPFIDFMRRYPQWWLILLFILCYRLPDGFIAQMTTPFFIKTGFTKTEIATIAKLFGFGATLTGMFIGGMLISRLGLYRSLLALGLFQIFANLTYVGLAVAGPDLRWLTAAITMDNLSGGMVTAAGVAFIMRLCKSADHTATHYALLSSLATAASTTLAGTAGFIAQEHGWVTMFGLSAVLGAPAIALLVFKRGWMKGLAED